MNRRTRATGIPKKVKHKVYKRDREHCVLCGRYALPEWACAHYIARSHGGLGVEQNILTLCPDCHMRYDNTVERGMIKIVLAAYWQSKYDDWDERNLVYDKWQQITGQ